MENELFTSSENINVTTRAHNMKSSLGRYNETTKTHYETMREYT